MWYYEEWYKGRQIKNYTLKFSDLSLDELIDKIECFFWNDAVYNKFQIIDCKKKKGSTITIDVPIKNYSIEKKIKIVREYLNDLFDTFETITLYFHCRKNKGRFSISRKPFKEIHCKSFN